MLGHFYGTEVLCRSNFIANKHSSISYAEFCAEVDALAEIKLLVLIAFSTPTVQLHIGPAIFCCTFDDPCAQLFPFCLHK